MKILQEEDAEQYHKRESSIAALLRKDPKLQSILGRLSPEDVALIDKERDFQKIMNYLKMKQDENQAMRDKFAKAQLNSGLDDERDPDPKTELEDYEF